MNFTEAQEYRNKYGNLSPAFLNCYIDGKLTIKFVIKPLIISPPGMEQLVFNEMLSNDGDNQKALIDLELIDKKLIVSVSAINDAQPVTNEINLISEDLKLFVQRAEMVSLN